MMADWTMVPGASDKGKLWNDSATSATGSKRKMSITMAISPDLDALLEFDEKARRAQLKGPGYEKPVATTVPVGLPPPPRSGYTRPPTSPMVSSPLTREIEPAADELSMPNPYINDPPPLEIVRAVFHGGGGGLGGQLEDDELPLPKTGGGAASDQLFDHQGRPSASSAPPRNRVTKLLKTGKIRPGYFFDGPSSAPAQVEPPWNLRERVLTKGTLAKVTDSEPSSMVLSATTGDGNELVEMEGDDHGDDGDDRRWDVDSHDEWSRRWSESSGVSPSSSPAPSTSAHISISSTFYSDSPVSEMYHSSPPLGRESFMDIRPPAPAQAPLLAARDRPASQPSSPTSSPKPPIPNTPKPIFRKLSPKTSPAQQYIEPKNMSTSPQTNFLDLDERSDLIRKNKKLVRLFGQSPGHDALLRQDLGRSNKPHLPVLPTVIDRGVHTALSTSPNKLEISVIQRASTYPYRHDRRHSAPLSPDEISVLGSPINRKPTDHSLVSSSVSSFIDLSDDLGSASPKTAGDLPGRPHSPSQQSVFENMSAEEQAEECRRRKREKLARLHRFLGSQVPVHLALGLDDPETSLPPLRTDVISGSKEDRKVVVRRRRCSSVEAYPPGWSDESDRIRQDLNVREKAINVRRAQKMEKVFGVAPPQTLYHTRSSPSPSLVPTGTVASSKFVSGWISSGDNLPPMTGQRNLNQSSYVKAKKKKDQRPSTSESNKQLLTEHQREWGDFPILKKRPSIVYSHYQSSLNNLNDLMDKDDRESLASLRVYLHSGNMTVPPPLQSFGRTSSGDRRSSNASSIRSERRLSLPTSVVSFSSDHSPSLTPEVSDFQARRRKAAKLTQFFGVDYRELVGDIIDSIERGVEHEQTRGTLNQDEVQDLLARLRRLRTKREGFF